MTVLYGGSLDIFNYRLNFLTAPTSLAFGHVSAMVRRDNVHNLIFEHKVLKQFTGISY